MIEQLIALALEESKWLFTAMLLALIAVLMLTVRQQRRSLSSRFKMIGTMNLFYGVMIGVMSIGHLLAVTVKFFQGTLGGSLGLLYALGLALAIPAWWLVFEGWRIASFEQRERKKFAALNVWLGISLLALGVHNLPLAVPAAWNIAYQFHSKRVLGWAILAIAIIATLALFVGSLVFFASGQSFEQFKGMP